MSEKIVIYPDPETDFNKLKNITADKITVYDNLGIITTDYETVSSNEIFSDSTTIILTQNCRIRGEYNTKNLENICIKLQDFVDEKTLVIFDTILPPRTVFKMHKKLDEHDLLPNLNLAYVVRVTEDTLVISGETEESIMRTENIYSKVRKNIKTTEHIQTAEIIPLLQNAYKDTVTALSNQIAMVSPDLTVDLIEAIDFANLKDDVHLLYPKSISKNNIIRDSDKFIKLANEYGETANISDNSRSTNNYVPYQIAYMAEKELYLKYNLSFYEIKVAILGITEDKTLFTEKNNPSLTLIDDLISRKAEVWVHDDNVSEELIESHGAKKITLDQSYECECIIIMTDNQKYHNLDPKRVDKILVTALPILSNDKFKDVELNVLGQYKLKKGETL